MRPGPSGGIRTTGVAQQDQRDYNCVRRHPPPGTEYLTMRAGIALIELLIATVVAAMTIVAVFGYLTR